MSDMVRMTMFTMLIYMYRCIM